MLHAAVISLFLISFERRPVADFQNPTGVSVVFDTPGAQQTQAPPHQVEGPPTPAEAPPPAAPPTPQTSEPEVNLNMPAMPLAALPNPAPQPKPQQPHRQAKASHQAPHYIVMNNMSYNAPSPPVPFAKRGLNLNLSADDMQAAAGQTLSIKGDAGSNWDADLNKWVNDHAYYPDAAVAQNQQGSVKIQFTVNRAGEVSGIKLLSGSGSPFLDQAWPGLFKDAQLPPFPADAKSDKVTVTATMHYILLH
ncbi:MAG: energy transducer TonB [Acidocella sp.]|nr:energy transducer TonB [Acidocella sp.]